jgi:hypothetical protein
MHLTSYLFFEGETTSKPRVDHKEFIKAFYYHFLIIITSQCKVNEQKIILL